MAMQVGVWKIPMASPNDVSQLAALIDNGDVDPTEIVALIGKTEGNGGANDFTRGYATLAFQQLLAARLGLGLDEIARRIAFVWSGGTEGVLSPHATVFTRRRHTETSSGSFGLVLGLAIGDDVRPEEIGRMAHVRKTTDAVKRALADAEIGDVRDVHYVQVKGPLLTPAKITDAHKRGCTTITRDPNGSKSYARGAMALGVAIALGEVEDDDITDAVVARDLSFFSNVASTSAGGELSACEVILLGNSSSSTSPFKIGHAKLCDAIDAAGVRAALASAGLAIEGAASGYEADRIVSVFAKAEASPDGMTRGRRHTMLSDADINYERHARAATGAVIASITSDPAIFVSGGTEHQCAPGEAPIAAIVRR